MKYFVVFMDSNTWTMEETNCENVWVVPGEYMSLSVFDEISDGGLKFSEIDVPHVPVSRMIEKLKDLDEWDSMVEIPGANQSKFFHDGPLPEGYEITSRGKDGDAGVCARLVNRSWHGPEWNASNLHMAVADAWKHVTKSVPMKKVEE